MKSWEIFNGIMHVFLQVVLAALSVNAKNMNEPCSSFYAQQNFKLDGHVLQKKSTTTYTHCIDECKLNTGCHSINYHLGNGVCELNSANHLNKPLGLVPAHGYKYTNYHHRKPTSCSFKYCPMTKDVCVVDNNGNDYSCIKCTDHGSQAVLTYPRKGLDTILLEHFFNTASLSSFTVSIWAQGAQSDISQIFGFAVTTHFNELGLALTSSQLKVYFKNLNAVLDIAFAHQSKWHHYLMTWENVGGSLKVYIDGVLKGTKTIATGVTLKQGAMTLGQDQDSYKGGLDAAQSFQGNMTNMNMWDRVLPSQDISALSQSCANGPEGNVLKWADLKKKGQGQITLSCSAGCV